jgi:hypothetical protein
VEICRLDRKVVSVGGGGVVVGEGVVGKQLGCKAAGTTWGSGAQGRQGKRLLAYRLQALVNDRE